MTTHPTTARGNQWHTQVKELAAWYAHHHTAPAPTSRTTHGFPIGTFFHWAQRRVHHAALSQAQLQDLIHATHSAEWMHADTAAYKRSIKALATFAHTHGHSHFTPEAPEAEDIDIAAFLHRVETDYRAGHLGLGKIMTLEALPGWAWCAYERARARAYLTAHPPHPRRPAPPPT